jgi:hypothetical protein
LFVVEATENRKLVPPPWLCRVNSIWLLTGSSKQQQQQQQHKGRRSTSGTAASAVGPKPKYRIPVGTGSDVIDWEEEQMQCGRFAAHHFQLQVCD